MTWHGRPRRNVKLDVHFCEGLSFAGDTERLAICGVDVWAEGLPYRTTWWDGITCKACLNLKPKRSAG